MSYENTGLTLPRGVLVKTERGYGWENKAENPYYFMCAMLADVGTDEEFHCLEDGKKGYIKGEKVSPLNRLKDIDGSEQGFFVFPDLSKRVEGSYKLRLSLFETVRHIRRQ